MSRQIHASSELPRQDSAVDSPNPQPSPVAAAMSFRQSTSRAALEKSIKHMNDAQRTVQDKISFFGHENERPVLRPNGSIEGKEGREGKEPSIAASPKVASPKSAFGTSWYSEESPSERKWNAKVKITYSHIGFGPEDEVRIRLRETLSASSVRIEAEDEQGALSATEIRILTEELCKFGRREQANCQNLTLGFCGLSDDAAQELGDMLSKNKRLEVLNLWDNKIATSGGESIGQGLRSNITLKFLNMRSNDLGPLGALGIAKGLMDNNALLSLSIRYNWIGDDGAKAFAALLLSNNTIRELDVSRNRIGSEGTQALMKALWHNQSLTDLNLQLNHIYDKGGLFIGSALSHNETLESLDFMGCLLGDAGCVSIFQSLGAAPSAKVESEQQMRRKKNLVANHKVKFLLLSGNEIGDIGGLTMGLALKVNRGLVRLDLSKNRLRDKGATALGDALASNNVLEELNLNSNSIADAGLRSLADAMSVNNTLTMLDVTNNAASFKTGVGGILDNLKLTTFRSDLNLVRAELFAMGKAVRGFQQNISNAFEGPGKVQRPVEIFANLSRSLMSLRSLDNKLGHESPAELSNTLGEFLNQSSQLLDLNLARNNLRCDHIKVLSFSTLTFLDISQNSISNSGMDYLVGSLIKVKPSPLIRELDLSHNQIYKIPTGLAHLTSLECLFLEGNHVIRMVAMSAVQAGIKSVTQWIIKWARMQLELSQVAKGQVIKDNTNTQGADEESSVSPTTSPVRPATSPRKNIGCCSEYPALYEPIPCFAVFGTAKRFKNDTDEIDATPGPADASPWIHCKEGDKYQRVVFQEKWRNIVARTKADSNSYKNGAVISHTAELDDEQEEAVLAVRDALMQDSFNGRSALPSDWAEPRNKIMLQKAKEAQRLRKFNVVKRPDYREQYGVKSIVSRIKRDFPQWQINDIQVIRTLKKHSVYHSDQRHFEMRPALETARNLTPEPGVVPAKPSIKEQEEWKSRVIFLKGFNAVFRSKKLQGFSQFMIRTLDAQTHEKVMDLARTYWRTVQVNDKPLWDTSNEQEAALRVREFVRQVYIESFTLGYYNKEDFYKHARFVLKRNPQGQDDETSIKLIQQGSFMGLFRYCDPPSPIPRASFMDSMLREASSLADVGPGSYDPDYYHALGADSEKGPTIALPLELPPNTVPGPGAYFPDHAGRPKEPQADKKILPHYIVPVGGSNIEPQMQELVTCLPNAVADAKQWLEEVGPSLGLQVQLLKAQNWLGNVDVTPRPHPPKKLRPATTTTTPRPNSTATCTAFVSGAISSRKREINEAAGSERRVFRIVGAEADIHRLLGDKNEMARVGLIRSPSKGPNPVTQSAGPAYNVPSVFDMDNRLFSAPTRAGHVQTRDWIEFRNVVETGQDDAQATPGSWKTTPGPGTYRHMSPDRTGKWESPIERVTSGPMQSKACQGSYAYTMGLPRKMLPHMDPMSSARRTPSVQSYETFTTDKTGHAFTFLESRLSTVPSCPAHRIALKTPYTGADLKFTRQPDNGVPGVGSYDTEQTIGAKKLISLCSVPSYSISHDTLKRSSADVTHVVVGHSGLATNTDLPQRPQTIEARMHSSCHSVDGQTVLKSTRNHGTLKTSSTVTELDWRTMPRDTLPRSQSPPLQRAEVHSPSTHTGTTRLRPRPPASPPTRILSTLKDMDPDIPGMQTYNIPHTIGYDKNPIVRNAPQYTIPMDWAERSKPIVYTHTDSDFAVAVVTPRSPLTARARLHPTHPDAFSPRSLRGRHMDARTSKSVLAAQRQASPIKDDLALAPRRLKTGAKPGKGLLLMPPKTAR